MKNALHIIFLLCCGWMAHPLEVAAQQKHETIQVEDGNTIVRLDKRRPAEFASLIEYFGINEDSLFRHGSLGKLENEGWRIIKVRKNLAVIGQFQEKDSFMDWLFQPIFFDDWMANGYAPGYPIPVDFGVNSFLSTPTVFMQEDGTSLFTLKGHSDASEVYLSGNFNSWSTQSIPMQRSSDGWQCSLPLRTGKYLYKFIVDGNWLNDPANKQGEADGYGGSNSVYFVYNHVFKLAGYGNAKSVYFASSLNDWREKEFPMRLQDGIWQLPAYVREGTYTYKFIVDGEWLLDPDNPMIRPDGMGNTNSVLRIGSPVVFELRGFTNADTVMLAGNFNDWNGGDLGMQRYADGWRLEYVLGPGNYEYKFIVDGRWITDPANPRRYTGDAEGNAIITVKPNHTLRLNGYDNAKSVSVSGSFNNWADPGYAMVKDGSSWVCPVYLSSGKHRYKFVVDGTWILDPENPQTEDNEFSTYNSVLWIDAENAYFFR